MAAGEPEDLRHRADPISSIPSRYGTNLKAIGHESPSTFHQERIDHV